ncbi:MAG TPA: hypothetical protein VF092_15710 [Longimicrobium sp.]
MIKSDGSVSSGAVDALSATDLVDIGLQSAELTAPDQGEDYRTSFSHSASLSLAGGSYPCNALRCRLERAAELAQFAAFYSDKVYIHNHLSDLAAHRETTSETDVAKTRQQLKDDLEIYLLLKPLIEAGRIVPVTAPQNWCPHCLKNHLADEGGFGEETELALARATRNLRERFLVDASVELQLRGGEFWAVHRGPEDLLEHGYRAVRYQSPPKQLRDIPEVMPSLLRNRSIHLSSRQREKFEMHIREASSILDNVVFELTMTQAFGASLLTERKIHVDILRSMSSDSRQERRNAALQKHLTTVVPFLSGVVPADLLHLRETEGDAFIVFRNSINKMIDEALSQPGEITERDARQIYGDLIEPELARLDIKMKLAQKTLAKTARQRIAAWVGAIGVGVYTGFVPSTMIAAAKALGLTKVVADLGELLLGMRANQNAIRSDDLYFLWRVRKLSSR